MDTLDNPVKVLAQKTLISLLLGIVGLFLNMRGLTIHYLDYSLTIPLGHTFPLLIALAWGAGFSVPGAIVASLFVFFIGLEEGVGALIYHFVFFTAWIPVLGRLEEKRKWNESNPLMLYLFLLAYTMVNGVIYSFFFFKSGHQGFFPGRSQFLYSYVDNMSLLSCLNLTQLLIVLPPVRSILGFDKQEKLRRRMGYRFILGALAGVFILWGLTTGGELFIEGGIKTGERDYGEVFGEVLVNNFLYLNIIIVLALVMFQNWVIQSDTKRKMVDRGDILMEILNNIAEGVIVLDENWKVRFANPVAHRLMPSGDFQMGTSIRKLVKLYDPERGTQMKHSQIIHQLVSGEPMTCLMAQREGCFRRIIIQVSSLPRTKYGYRYLSLIRDITEEYEREQTNIHFQKQEAVGRLVGGVAHDFNNRLAGILGFAQLITLEEDREEINLYAEQITASAQAAADLTSQLLTLSRKRPMQQKRLSLNELIQGVLPVLKHTVSKGIEFHWDPSEEELFTIGDKSLLENALLNLAINGAHAMEKKGVLTFILSTLELTEVDCLKSKAPIQPGPFGVIEVIDTGSGMSQTTIDKIFDPFFTTKEEGKGTGLGLSTVKEIAEKHGGEIRVKSSPGTGSTFSLLLPLSQDGRA
ncbi:MAG: ATP-binding protein [Spirochaetales bacterium]|nr:ATP-binding protein [Spirochaetales bacterium]